jgi:hypothetical protein
MSQEWDIKACGKACAGTGEPFADRQLIHSCLYFSEAGYTRKDFSEAGWNAAAREGAVSVWQSEYHAPPPPTPEVLRKETAETLLRQLIAKEDFSRKNVIYILAVMLERKRILGERDVQVREDGSKIRIYEHKKTGEVFTIPDPDLKLKELATVEQEVAELLGIRTASTTPAPPAPPAPAPAS